MSIISKYGHAGKKGVKSGEGFYDYSESRKAEKVSASFK